MYLTDIKCNNFTIYLLVLTPNDYKKYTVVNSKKYDYYIIIKIL